MGAECVTFMKPSRGAPPTRCVGESGVARLRIRLLQRLQVAHQLVVLGVGDLRRVRDVIEILVAPECLA